VTFAASTAFMTPVGYQTNLFVYGPGGYRFMDYVKVSAPLQAIFAVVTTLGIAFFWGLTPGDVGGELTASTLGTNNKGKPPGARWLRTPLRVVRKTLRVFRHPEEQSSLERPHFVRCLRVLAQRAPGPFHSHPALIVSVAIVD